MVPPRENLLAAVCPKQREVFSSKLLRWCLITYGDFRAEFLKAVAFKAGKPEFYKLGSQVEVTPEEPIDEGRLDLLIEPTVESKSWLIVVEVKVAAPFAMGQLAKYKGWIEQKQKEYDTALVISLTRDDVKPPEADGHLSWADIRDLLRNKASTAPMAEEILEFVEKEILPVKITKLNPQVLAQFYQAKQLEEELTAFLKKSLHPSPPFNDYFANQSVKVDREEAPSNEVYVGLYKWADAKPPLLDLYVGFKIDSRGSKLSLFIQRQFKMSTGEARLAESLKKIEWEGPNIKEARLDARKEEQVVPGDKFDENPAEMVRWFKDEVEKVMKIK
jgi:hypothetical protein